jgi:acetyl-CoA decarbonylase/synthase complex subunit delta
MPAVEIPEEKWSGKIREVTLGGNGRKSVVVGGETTLPFLHFEGSIPHRPRVAIEIQDFPPRNWAAPLLAAWGDALQDPAKWAKKAAEYGADLIALHLRSAHPDEMNTGPEEAVATVEKVLAAVDLPLMVLGPYVAEKDNEVLVPVADAARGQRIALGYCEEKNHRTIVAACIANEHVAIARTPIDMNLAKQLNILIADVGLSPDSILMDPLAGALGYGLEYSYSVMERLRLAALSGDSMTAMPMYCSVGDEVWRQKEAMATEGIPETWGAQELRSLLWEEITALALLQAGADILVLRHPRSVEMVKSAIDKLMG